jgi:hypothetical protein
MTLDVWADGADAPTVVEVKPRTVLQWEKENLGRSGPVQLTDDAMQITYMYELAWIVMGKPGGDFGKWWPSVDVTYAQDGSAKETTPDPTNAEAPTDS